jgi:hypothetical protein
MGDTHEKDLRKAGVLEAWQARRPGGRIPDADQVTVIAGSVGPASRRLPARSAPVTACRRSTRRRRLRRPVSEDGKPLRVITCAIRHLCGSLVGPLFSEPRRDATCGTSSACRALKRWERGEGFRPVPSRQARRRDRGRWDVHRSILIVNVGTDDDFRERGALSRALMRSVRRLVRGRRRSMGERGSGSRVCSAARSFGFAPPASDPRLSA